MTERNGVVWVAGVTWDAVPGTDRRLAEALAITGDVLWLDAPSRGGWRGWLARARPAVSAVHPAVLRLRSPGLPGFSRFPIRIVTAALQRMTIRRNLGLPPRIVVVANPVCRFPRGVPGVKVLFVTDDWIAGAGLMGYSPTWLERVLTANLREADAVIAVTPALLETVERLAPSDARVSSVVPNGAPKVPRIEGIERDLVAGVVGQLNERLDMTILEAVADAGVRLRLIGPRTDSDVEFSRRLDALIARPDVEWAGAVSPDELPAHFAALGVGLTPYADTDFNRASFPLKTLEYLAAGLPVVSTDLPASRWIESDDVWIGSDTRHFVTMVRQLLDAVRTGEDGRTEIDARIAFAAEHGWDRRADQIRAIAANA